MPMPRGLFQREEESTIFGPRAATVDAAADRQNLLQKRRAIEDAQRRKAMSSRIYAIPGLIDRGVPGPGDNEIYAQGLQAYLAGNTQGAVDAWASIPHQPEARRGLQRIYQQLQRQGGVQ